MRIYPDTFVFLKELAENNNRDWFMANKKRHDEARENVIEFSAALVRELSKIDPAVNADIDPKKTVMRIYRDIRFSADKTPYKNNFAIGRLTTAGTLSAGYYIHIQPDNSGVAGGTWMPEAEVLKKIRQEIDYNAGAIKKIIDDPEYVKLFGDFRSQEKIKTVPREYSADNENIELLKLKSFIAWHDFTDKEMMEENITGRIALMCEKIYPLNVFLNNAIA
ncbi:MAG TPA: DUF2461 domain-containing protein [Mucilaginibacter sp.]|nr:DUF2461 domain-containing protein [Mucilaginibacter sp.]